MVNSELFPSLETIQEYKARIEYLLTHAITKNYLILFGGRGIGACIGFAIGVLLPRYLSPSDYGIYAMVVALFDIAVVFAELGIGTALVRFVSLHICEERKKANYYMVISFWILVVSGLVVSVSGIALSDIIAEWFYFKPQLSIYIKLGFVSVLGSVLWSYSLSSLQAREAFGKYATASVFAGALKLILVLLLIYFVNLTVSYILIIQIIVPIVVTSLVLYFTSTRLVGIKGDFKDSATRLLNFSKWTFLIDLSVMAFSRVDILILGRYANEATTGYYNVAVTLVYPFTVLISSFVNVLFPRVSRLSKIDELKDYVKKVVSLNLVCAVFLLPAIYFAGDIIRFLFTKSSGVFEYEPAIIMFQIMFFGFLFNFIIEPVYLIAYAVDKPRIIAYICLFKLLICFTMYLVLTPIYYGVGAAIASVTTHVVGGIFAIYLIHKSIFKHAA